MKRLILVGGGGHCKSVLDATLAMHEFDDIVITDPDIPAGNEIMGYKVVGSDEILPELKEKGYHYAFVTVGSIKNTLVRRELVNKLESIGFQFPVICDPSAIVSPTAIIGKGTFIGKRAVLNSEVKVGEHCIINTGAIIEHESVVGDYTHVSIGAIACGNCNIGKNCFLGAGSTLIQGIRVGDGSVVGAGAAVTQELSGECTAVGVPAHVC
ncbi:acetyltransferase [Butyrivibrio sp. XPD2006]|uniref:acetyltransferase n=1 Tax=Butyrivibrio sp. XPD2006 TaxID=1280668 RepID=UPI0003B36F1D|nr:acetyltransferase [Butyrivibrio sp. XPD2006]